MIFLLCDTVSKMYVDGFKL